MAKKTKQRTPRVSDQLRAIIETCGISRYELAKRTGIDAATFCRFVAGDSGLSSKALDKLGAVLGLEVVMRNPPAK